MVQSLIASSIIGFFSTTLDDFAVMLIFFAEARMLPTETERRFGYIKCVVGQTLGFTIVVILSLFGLLLDLFIPEEYIDLIGFLPLIMGLQKLWELMVESKWCGLYVDKASQNKEEYSKVHGSDLHGIELGIPKQSSAVVVSTDVDDDDTGFHDEEGTSNDGGEGRAGHVEDEEEKESNSLSEFFSYSCQSTLDPFTLKVTAFALACSSDNIGIYVAIFAALQPWQAVIVTLIFYVLLIFNIAVAYALTQNQFVASLFTNHSKNFVPPLLCFLGLYILSDSVISPL